MPDNTIPERAEELLAEVMFLYKGVPRPRLDEEIGEWMIEGLIRIIRQALRDVRRQQAERHAYEGSSGKLMVSLTTSLEDELDAIDKEADCEQD